MSILKEATDLIDVLDLRIEKINSTKNMFSFMEHAVCRILTADGKKVSGRGMAFNERSAFEKAIGEALERYIYISDGSFPNTNGMALHSSIEIARRSAFQELMERDAYLCHYYTKTPFFRCLDSDLGSSIYRDVSRILNRNDFDLIVARLSSSSDQYISIAACIGTGGASNYGFSLGLSCQPSSTSSINASIMEAVSDVPSFLEGFRPRVLTKDEFFKLEKVTVFDFAALAHNAENFSDMASLFDLQEDFKPSDFSPAVKFVELAMPELLKKASFTVVKARSPDCQELFFDNDIKSNLNFVRLKSFTKNRSDIADFPLLPHYFA